MNETRLTRNPITRKVQPAEVIPVDYSDNDDPLILHLADGSHGFV